eukprot:TRINITY_DN106378_c0_g1_i1.p2 TRINITY_DN106378_c0_g1~~TRINITY_DN106378_c0_g1_i1.p2  ORF type:complete len:175 (+),score=25.02 TRINITY_DN106378_c0_g1_i1:127-651(+)
MKTEHIDKFQRDKVLATLRTSLLRSGTWCIGPLATDMGRPCTAHAGAHMAAAAPRPLSSASTTSSPAMSERSLSTGSLGSMGSRSPLMQRRRRPVLAEVPTSLMRSGSSPDLEADSRRMSAPRPPSACPRTTWAWESENMLAVKNDRLRDARSSMRASADHFWAWDGLKSRTYA